MLEQLKQRVFEQNLALVKNGLVILTWGNASAICREKGLIVIKPSGVSYDKLLAEDMVVVDLSGNVVEGKLKPSSDTATHIQLYNAFKNIGGIVHTHSTYATAWAQSGKDIPCFGTTHADTFYGNILCTRGLTEQEIKTDYEKNTGLVIVNHLKDKDYNACPAILVKSHAPFTWGESIEKAVENSVILEQVARMARLTIGIDKDTPNADKFLQDKHYFRKHGKNSTYGQK